MNKFLKKLVTPVITLFFLLNMSSAGIAETTVSAEVGFIFNTLISLSSSNILLFFLSTNTTFVLLTIDIGTPGIPPPVPKSKIHLFSSPSSSIIL